MKALTDAGVGPATVRRAVQEGLLVQLSRGTYRLAGTSVSEDYADIAAAIARVPKGLVCLLSAAAFHGLISELPAETWIAIPYRHNTPKIDAVSVRFMRWVDENAFLIGIINKSIYGVDVRLTNPARTVIDMMRMATVVGEDISRETLVAYLNKGGLYTELNEIATILGVEKRLANSLGIAKVIAEAR